MTVRSATTRTRPRDSMPLQKRSRRTIRRSVTVVLVIVAVLSVLLLAALNYWQARSLLTDTISNALIDQQATRVAIVRDGLARIQAEVAITADNPEVVDALSEFAAAYEQLDQTPDLLSAGESQALETFYREQVIARMEQAGLVAPQLAELLPQTDAGRYLQYHYIIQNPFPPDERVKLVDAQSDDSQYAFVHAKWHEDLVRFTNAAVGSVLLVDAKGRIIYSTQKEIDLGTDTVTGPYRDTALATAVTKRLPTVPIGQAVIVDFERYLPAAGQPTMFAAAAVQSEATVIGALVIEIKVEALNAITTSGGRWEEIGLGKTGETYVVGADRLMRSDSRFWLEDPEAYLATLEKFGATDPTGDLISLFGSTVLLQTVDTKVVNAAFDGERFIGQSNDYLGHPTLAVASPVGAADVNWVLVAAVGRGEATQPLTAYTRRMLTAAAILVPLVILLGTVLARRLTRPIEPIVSAAAHVAAGNLDTEFPDLGRNEFGDLSRRLNTLTRDLRLQETALEKEERETANLLLSALPPRLVTQLRAQERRLEDLVDTATIVALSVAGLLDRPGIDQDSALELSVRLSQGFEQIADDVGLERVRSSSTLHVFASGLAAPGYAAPLAAEFALRAGEVVETFAEENGLQLNYTAGLCAGEVVAGLVEADQLTYGVFGDAARVALSLESVAGPGQILVCDTTAGLLATGWSFAPVPGLVDLRGDPVAARQLVARSIPTTDTRAAGAPGPGAETGAEGLEAAPPE